MPLVKQYHYEQFPDWCELRKYEICEVKIGETRQIDTGYPMCAIFPLQGRVTIMADGERYVIDSGKTAPGQGIVLESGAFTMMTEICKGFYLEKAKVFVCSGVWPKWAKIAMFHFDRVDHPENPGTPVDYFSNTCFDNHYHDYDEYWLPLMGKCTVYSEGIPYTVEPGDCICTRRGTHHHAAVADGPISSIGFGSRIRQNGDPGFLWVQTHGEPVED